MLCKPEKKKSPTKCLAEFFTIHFCYHVDGLKMALSVTKKLHIGNKKISEENMIVLMRELKVKKSALTERLG